MLRLTLMGIKVTYYGDLGSLISPISEEAALGIICREGWYSEEHGLKFFRANASEEFPIYVWQDHAATNRFLLHFATCTFLDATGAALSKQRLRALRKDHSILGELFEREEKKLLEHYELASAYADRLFNGSWDEFVQRVYSVPEFALKHSQVLDCMHQKALEDVILRSPLVASRYARDVLNGRWPAGEAVIASDAEAAVHYAALVLRQPWPEAEKVIAGDPVQAARYAELVKRDRWKSAEKHIATDLDASWNYLTSILGERWLAAENIISTSPVHAAQYARDYISGKWPQAEVVIASDAEAALIYSRDVLKRRWTPGEGAISADPVVAAKYSYQVLKGPWKEAEDVIQTNAEASYRYVLKALKRQRSSAFEQAIMASPRWACFYAIDVIGGRWFAAEPAIMAEPSMWDIYRRQFGDIDIASYSVAV